MPIPLQVLALGILVMAIGFGGALHFLSNSECVGRTDAEGWTKSYCQPTNEFGFIILTSLGLVGGVNSVVFAFVWQWRAAKRAAPLPS